MRQGRNPRRLARSVEAELAMPVQMFDPFGGLFAAPRCEACRWSIPAFAPLLGDAGRNCSKRATRSISFIPAAAPAPSKCRKWIMAGAARGNAAAVYRVYAACKTTCWPASGGVKNEKKLLDGASATPEAKKRREAAAAVAKWAADDNVWLDQFPAMSKN